MTDQDQSVSRKSVLLNAAAFVVVIAGLRVAAPIIIPFLIAMFLAIICSKALERLRQARIPTPLALLAIVAFMTIAVILLMTFVGASLNQLVQKLPEYQTRIDQQKQMVIDWLKDRDIADLSEEDLTLFDAETGVRMFGTMLSGVSGLLGDAFLILLLFAFLLLEAAAMPLKVARVAGPDGMRQVREIIESVRQYVGIKAIVSLVTGGAIALWLWALGVEYAFLWGTLAFLLNFVPNIGSIMAAVPAVVVALFQPDGLTIALYAAAGYVVVNIVLGNIVEPRVMGKGLGLSTLVVFLSLVFWGWVFGPVGMLLSVPLTMTAKIILDASEETRWMAVMLGPD